MMVRSKLRVKSICGKLNIGYSSGRVIRERQKISKSWFCPPELRRRTPGMELHSVLYIYRVRVVRKNVPSLF